MRIVFLIRSFAVGGAENQLALAADALARRGHDVTVIVLSKQLDLAQRLVDGPVRLVCIEKRSRWDFSGWLLALAREFRQTRPAVLCGWLPAESLIGYAVSSICAPMPYIWAVRASNVNLYHYDWLTRIVYRLHHLLIRLGAGRAVVFNSHAGAAAYGLSEDGRRCNILWNAVDPTIFRPRTEVREPLRRELRLPATAPVIAIFGRLIPAKDYNVFLRAARRVRDARPDARFLIVGGGAPAAVDELRRWIGELELGDAVAVLGSRRDVVELMNAADVVVSTSKDSEGVQNTIIEAMSCGRPVVATNVGDVARFVSDLDRVIPPGAVDAIAEAILQQLGTDTDELRRARVAHATAMFGVERMCDRFEQVVRFAQGRA
jgi:glycosyltransferase involved in cell wall biosynthesis